jgi:hypothetical protein
MIEELICLRQDPDTTPPRLKVNWKRPEAGWRKVNTDASFEMATGSGSGGVVIRDEDGKVLQAASKFYDHIPDVLTAEALAARDDIQLARVCGYEKVVLEADNLALVNLLRSATADQSVIAGLWHEISDLSNSFNSFLVSFINREGHKVAHFCAKLSS